MNTKPWWKSKVIWANVLGLLALAAKQFNVEPTNYTEEQIGWILAVVNFILRFYTKQPIAPQPPVKEA